MVVKTFIKWLPVNGYNGYFISNNGLVKNKNNILLSQKPDAQGRMRVVFKNSFGEMTYRKGSGRVHRLVYEHFSGERLIDGHHIHHKDGNYLNNHIDNLMQLTPSDHYKLHANGKR